MNSAVSAHLKHYQPKSLLECSNSPWRELEQFCRDDGIPFSSSAPQDIAHRSDPVDLAIVHDALENAGPLAGQQMLGHLRNSLAQRIWLLVAPSTDWPLHALIALGFKKDEAQLADSGLDSYTYDLSSYNHKRSWNNAQYWANPENFDKYRW